MDLAGPLVQGFAAVITPHLWWLIPLLLVVIVMRFPMLGRGPNSSRRDPWRGFKFAARTAVMDRAGRRCEAGALLAWGRCGDPAVEVDHVIPWSRGGPTVVSNGQALCKAHNRSKGSWVPPWWYILGLERRRRGYVPAGSGVRVLAVMNDDERAARERWAQQRTARP
ncbi:HNH endonuclease signature motif containing protein [Agrococcus sp. ARC_14]|uniref:HNH endonuclease n=1 Tax=Agrococcus sp. ARC_14 TaxID=2919927 RepID=UPI001F0521B6|nr:HNH endonuclease signature motif containing protein [Agrococcus sp. ARC_14]MCH1881940.1 HNH endonuclease [Agrococcus sp. ARC_14]